jgi:hypothetical protein
VPAHANGCDDGICTASSPFEIGHCLANAPDRYCDGFLRANGDGMVSCTTGIECALAASECPGGHCGNCNHTQVRSCFPDPFGAKGTDGVPGSTVSSGAFGAGMGASLCVPATGTSLVDEIVGLPGPGRVQFDFDFESRCASDPSVVFQPPGGSNCP